MVLTKDDHHIFWGEANNIPRIPTPKSLNKISNYLLENQHSNVTLINILQ